MTRLYDAGAQARLFGDGPDLLGLLQRLSTGDVASLAVDASATTVLTSAKGRIVAHLYLHRTEAGLWLVGGAEQGTSILDHLKKYTFAERTGLADRSETHALLGLWGDDQAALLDRAGLADVADGEARSIEEEAWLLGHDGETRRARSILVPRASAERWRERLLDAGAVETSGDAIDRARVEAGIPTSRGELNDEANPLEAGLRDAVSFTKGCYVGQEVVARLENYDKVSRQLVRIAADRPLEVGERLVVDGREAGKVTSVAGHAGIAYVKRRLAGPGDRLQLGDGNDEVSVEALG